MKIFFKSHKSRSSKKLKFGPNQRNLPIYSFRQYSLNQPLLYLHISSLNFKRARQQHCLIPCLTDSIPFGNDSYSSLNHTSLFIISWAAFSANCQKSMRSSLPIERDNHHKTNSGFLNNNNYIILIS